MELSLFLSTDVPWSRSVLETDTTVLLGLGGSGHRISEQDGASPLQNPLSSHTRSPAPPTIWWLRPHAYLATLPRWVEPLT